MMFKYTPKILAHISSLKTSNFAVPEYILNQSDAANTVNLFHRHCPHRRYPLADPGTHVDNITCKFHNFQWDKNGVPLNNNKKLSCGTATVGRSGLVFKDFAEPDHTWVNDLSNEKNLVYSHNVQGSSHGSWLWLMDAEADYLHVQGSGIHPRLSTIIDLDKVLMEDGNGWILQTHKPNWWSLYIYPFTFIEYTTGCLSINYNTPTTPNSEFGFTWITQFYYDPNVTDQIRKEFETLEDVFKEDVAAAELQKGNYFPLMTAVNKFEDHCIHFGQWVKNNRA
jgi:nitrite reductase/ring-hydroxylating ferredoxin subunit